LELTATCSVKLRLSLSLSLSLSLLSNPDLNSHVLYCFLLTAQLTCSASAAVAA